MIQRKEKQFEIRRYFRISPYRFAIRYQTILVLLVTFSLFQCDRNLPGTLPTMEIRIGGEPLTVEVAADPDSRTAGLKGRETMAAEHGMLFAFPAPQKVGFYMKDTPLPLDVAFFDEQGFLIEYFSMHPDDGKAIYTSPEPAIYAIETNRGWFRERGISKYAQLELPEPVRGR